MLRLRRILEQCTSELMLDYKIMVDDGKSGKLTEIEEVRVENDDKTFILRVDPAHQEIGNGHGPSAA